MTEGITMPLPEGEPIEGESGDRLFAGTDGRRWRARVETIARLPTIAPTRGVAELPVAGVTLSISVALLDHAGAVARDAGDRAEVFDAETLPIGDAVLGNHDCDPASLVLAAVQRRIAAAEAALENRVKLATLLDEWNAVVPFVPASPPVPPPPPPPPAPVPLVEAVTGPFPGPAAGPVADVVS